MEDALPMHEGDSLRSYQPPGFYGMQQPQDFHGMQQPPQQTPPIRYCRNPCDGTVLHDSNDTPVSIPKILATKPLRNEIQTRPGPGGKKMAYLGGEQVVGVGRVDEQLHPEPPLAERLEISNFFLD